MSSETRTLVAELFAFAIIVFVLYRYVWPILARMAGGRQDAIAQQVEESEEAARKLAAAEGRLEQALTEARAEAAMIRDGARADAQRIREELKAAADAEVERIRARGEEQLATQRDQVVRRLRAEIGALSLETAQKMVVEALADEGRRSATADTFLAELDAMAAQADEERARAAVHAGGAN